MTNQEKMQKIYELTGIEPKWWEDDEGLSPNGFVQDELLNTQWFKECAKPFYPAEQLWEICPVSVQIQNFTKKIIFVNYSSKVKYIQKEFDIGGNLLTALTDMVLWCIEQGYIKRGEG